MQESIEILRKFRGQGKSKWKDDAQWYRDNWVWLKYSKAIALKVRSRMQELSMTQKELAEKMGCSQQYISLILKGNENLTLETISKLEYLLEFRIMQLADSIVCGYNAPENRRYLSDNEGAYESHSEIGE